MPFPNFHAARIHDPAKYDEFAMKKITNGVMAVFGIKNGKSEIQSYRFKKDSFTVEQAKDWLKEHNISYMMFEEAKKIKALVLQCLSLKGLSEMEILSVIPDNVLFSIRLKDQHPYFQAFSICHEGVSTPTMIDRDSKPITWLRSAIQSIKGKIKQGIKFFLGHNKDNSTEGREALGEIVADTQKEIDGVLHHIVIGYFPDRDKVKNLDVCSQESIWNFFDKAGQVFADTLEKITGIALASSETDRPAFEGAKRLGMVQAFDDSGNDSSDNKNNKNKGRADMDLTTVNYSELLQEMKRRNTHPSQMFTFEEIKGDKVFEKEISKMEKDSKEKDEKIKALESDKAAKEKELLSSTVKSRVEEQLKTVSLSDNQRKFILARASSIPDFSDDGIKKFISDKIEDYKELVTQGVIKDDLPIQDDKNSKDKTDSNKTDFTKKENNELLEEDLEL